MKVRAQAPELVTIPRVPLVQVGLEYKASTGPVTFTEEDLVAAVAALDDPGIRTPGLKFGHNRKQLTQQPRVARIDNIVYDPDDMTVYGDYVGLPKWLADILPVAYPDRSIEGTFGMESATGRTHRFVLEDVALLGEDPPAVGTLDDLYELFYGDGSYFAEGKVAAVMKGGDAVPKRVAATVEVEDVRRAYYESLGPEQMWWWIRAIRLDPNELIVDDDEGSLYRVPFTISGDEVSFDEATPVKIVYEDVAQVAASLGAPLAVYASRAESRPETTASRKEEPVVDELTQIRKKLGLPEDASTEDILARLDANGETPPQQDPPPPEPNVPAEPQPNEVPQEDRPVQPAAQPSNINLPDGVVVVDQAQWEEMQAGVAAARQIAEDGVKARRDKVLAEAIQDAKIPRSRREHYEKMHIADPEGTEQLLASMPKGLVPISERGTSENGESAGESSAYPEHWFPEVRARKASHESGSRPRVQFASEG